MKIAAYNVENLFDRARALNTDDNALAKSVMKKTAELNVLFEKAVYTPTNLNTMRQLIVDLGIDKSDDGKFVILRQVRKRLLKRPQNKPFEFEATGRGDWVGWAELKTEPVNEIAIMNTGRVLRDVNADIIAVIEAENRIALKKFSDAVIKEVGGTPYDQVMVIDGNDDRGIDVGLMTRKGFSIGLMFSHIHDKNAAGKTIYSRDCPEYAVTTPTGELIWILPSHLKSKFGGDDPVSKQKRTEQASQTAAIYRKLRTAGHSNIVVLGDFNDTPDSTPLQPILQQTDLKDVSTHPSFDTGEFSGKGTFGLGSDNNKIDYILLSPALFSRITACGLFRKGAWPGKSPKRWTVYPELQKEVHVASDHHLIWVEIN